MERINSFCTTVATRGINFGILIKIPQNVELDLPLGWPGGEVKVTRKKNKIVFLPLMALGNESPKEFLFGVLEDLSQDLGFDIVPKTQNVLSGKTRNTFLNLENLSRNGITEKYF